MGALNTTVHVLNDQAEYEVFGPGDEVPAWALAKMGAHCFEDGVHPNDVDPDGDGPVPAKSAPKADWVAYAVSQGTDEAEAEAMTKEDLVTTFAK